MHFTMYSRIDKVKNNRVIEWAKSLKMKKDPISNFFFSKYYLK